MGPAEDYGCFTTAVVKTKTGYADEECQAEQELHLMEQNGKGKKQATKQKSEFRLWES
jgi:hypothetical protein